MNGVKEGRPHLRKPKHKELTKEQGMWLRLAEVEEDLESLTKKIKDVHDEFREYSLVKDVVEG